MTVPCRTTTRRSTWGWFLFGLLMAVCSQSSVVRASNYYYYYNNENDDNANDDANNSSNAGDDGNANQNGDDNVYAENATDDKQADDKYGEYQDDWASKNEVSNDDLFHWNSNVGFDGVSIMPVSCVNYNNGQMIKFQFFQSETSYQCHFAEIGTFVVSIAHYMRAYFNYQALLHGQDFQLPSDVGYLNCIKVQETSSFNEPLYAKIGCMERETFTSTKLSLHFYTDNTCSTPYDDGYSSRRHSNQGYSVKGNLISSEVSFRPPFYTCQTCEPEAIAETFNKLAGTFYDDDYISAHGGAREQGGDDGEGDGNDEDNGDDANDDGANTNDDYYTDDGYLSANDDVYRYRRLDTLEVVESSSHSSIWPASTARKPTPVEGALEAFEQEFWESIESQKRSLYENNYDANDWNMCDRVYKYGRWCDEDCRSLDAFRTDRWSGADTMLLAIMCTFLTSMMLLIVAKRLKAAQKRRSYSYDDIPLPGLPPVAMLAIFLAIITVISVLAKMKFINETLVFAVVTCILLFIYMLKLTLFDRRRPVLLATAQHQLFDNPLNERLYD